MAERESRSRRRNTTVVLLAKTQEDARALLAELAEDRRVVAVHVELGDSKYLIAVEDRV